MVLEECLALVCFFPFHCFFSVYYYIQYTQQLQYEKEKVLTSAQQTGSEYNFVYYGVLIGFLVVVLTYYLQRWMPNLETEYYLNAPIFFQSFSEIPIAPMTSFFSGFIASLVL